MDRPQESATSHALPAPTAVAPHEKGPAEQAAWLQQLLAQHAAHSAPVPRGALASAPAAPASCGAAAPGGGSSGNAPARQLALPMALALSTVKGKRRCLQ